MAGKKSKFEWEKKQVAEFRKIHPLYEEYSGVLKRVLSSIARQCAPLGIVQARTKSIASFAGKIQKKRHLYRNAVRDMTDLCGGRIIANTGDEVRCACALIEQCFEIDWTNSVQVGERHKPCEFGYRSVHYIVKFKPGVFPNRDVDVVIPEKLHGLKAEVQVRTLLEHAWSDFGHDRTYKSSFNLPRAWERELAGLAAVLEEVDRDFCRIAEGLETYRSSYGAYMTKEQILNEIEMQEFVFRYDRQNIDLAHRIGKLAMSVGDWGKAARVFRAYADSEYQPILRDLGVSICKLHKGNPSGREYRKGQAYLQRACSLVPDDTDALSSLAGTWKGVDEDRVRELYRRAFETDPADAYPLGNYLDCEIGARKDISIVACVKPLILNAIDRCRQQAEVGVNLPWGFFSAGKFNLLLGKPFDAVQAYCKAIQLSTDGWMIGTSRQSLEKLAPLKEQVEGYDWAHRLLLLGSAARFPSPDALKKIRQAALKPAVPADAPVLIVAGGCGKSSEKKMRAYLSLLLGAFANYRGTVICGGTTAGVSDLVGEVQSRFGEAIHAIGYLPGKIPVDAVKDGRYRETRQTGGDDFSPREPLQAWTDILASGIDPAGVKLLGIGGGAISAAEYRIALALGAAVAVIEDSGRAASMILADSDWNDSRRLLALPADEMTVRAFIAAGNHRIKPKPVRESIARAIHRNYLEARAADVRGRDQSMQDWSGLNEGLRESNRRQADGIREKLELVGYAVEKAGNGGAPRRFTAAEIEIMAEMEHARWVIERLLAGWKYGEKKDIEQKISPYLVPWDQLPEDVKEWDRQAVGKIPELLSIAGLQLRRKQ